MIPLSITSTPDVSGLGESLRKSGLIHINDLAFANSHVISRLLRLDILKTRSLQKAAISRVHRPCDNTSFMSGYDALRTQTSFRFSTGLTGLDRILGGGIEAGAITQLYGVPGTCKSQLCYTICTQLPPDNKAIYIDTTGKFRPERVEHIAISRNPDDEKILTRILVSTPFDSRQQEERIQTSEIIMILRLKVPSIQSNVTSVRT